ncbi:16S rRNA (guanine(527)-N(7))-methyltransferase RsmG [Roseobacter sp. CCS2]|uniref:16S rRNA (guanine(527)-N(7))-methyltransferase RsmG n=1 Tax=Roseobacter sp. CCS2 TaxID=391593 RepID=UPI0000F4023F|nr:16S rRNA (guanine(527)-N(7))-methyltransferase RsmG [Roseobacter sp. CCS2]EBA14140.1 glucose-inhibited division protein B [Roseobacter sp. CCS2]
MDAQVAGINVSRETIDNLEAFGTLVTKWTPKINLIASSTVATLWDRHIIDSAQIYRFAPKDYENWVDMGSGGGFPGIIMAIMAKSLQPDARFTLIESDQRKAIFLRTAARECGLRVDVIAQRIESVPKQLADVVSARALTALSGLLPAAERHLKSSGVALFHKGQKSQQEIADAKKNWTFDLEDYASITDPDARILAIRRIKTVGQ